MGETILLIELAIEMVSKKEDKEDIYSGRVHALMTSSIE